MVTIVGYNRKESNEGKPYTIIYYKDEKPITYGYACGSVICSGEYADKLISYVNSGGTINKGWSSKDKREFLYIPKEG